MTVAENIAFGLKLKKKSQQYIKDKIAYALKLVNMEGMEINANCFVARQQQRVAICDEQLLTNRKSYCWTSHLGHWI